MKYLLFLLISFYSLSFSAKAKRSPSFKYELGVNLYSITDYSNNGMFWDPRSALEHQFFSGLMFKRNWRKKALRVSLDYLFKSSEYYEEANWLGGTRYDYQSYLLIENRVGYEHQFLTYRNFKPYIGIELITGIAAFTNESIQTNLSQPPKHYYSQYNYFRLGLSPVLGIKYQISPRFSANIETSLGIIGTFLIKDNKAESQGGDVNFKPIRLLSINYHFKTR